MRRRHADPCKPVDLAFDYELALESDRGGHVESVGRSGLDYLVDFFELLRGRIALDVDGIAQAFVARLHGGIDAEEPAKVSPSVSIRSSSSSMPSKAQTAE